MLQRTKVDMRRRRRRKATIGEIKITAAKGEEKRCVSGSLMNITSWNVKGLRGGGKRGMIRRLTKEKKFFSRYN